MALTDCLCAQAPDLESCDDYCDQSSGVCQYPSIAEECLYGLADIECACGMGLGHGPTNAPTLGGLEVAGYQTDSVDPFDGLDDNQNQDPRCLAAQHQECVYALSNFTMNGTNFTCAVGLLGVGNGLGVPRVRAAVELLAECGLAPVALIPEPTCGDINAEGQDPTTFGTAMCASQPTQADIAQGLSPWLLPPATGAEQRAITCNTTNSNGEPECTPDLCCTRAPPQTCSVRTHAPPTHHHITLFTDVSDLLLVRNQNIDPGPGNPVIAYDCTGQLNGTTAGTQCLADPCVVRDCCTTMPSCGDTLAVRGRGGSTQTPFDCSAEPNQVTPAAVCTGTTPGAACSAAECCTTVPPPPPPCDILNGVIYQGACCDRTNYLSCMDGNIGTDGSTINPGLCADQAACNVFCVTNGATDCGVAVSKDDDFCIKNEELCIKSGNFVFKMMSFAEPPA